MYNITKRNELQQFFLIFKKIINSCDPNRNIIKIGGTVMERYAWKATVLPGKLDEYIERHDNIWPEMKEVLAAAGIRNYTIWNVGNELFGYYECDSVEFAAKVQAESPVVDRWNEYMKDVMVMEMDPVTGAQPLMKQVFFFG